ncbi:MAG: type II secretion system protein [Opitutales bacterium]
MKIRKLKAAKPYWRGAGCRELSLSELACSEKRHARGYLLIEVLVALALFGMAAVYLVDGAFVAARFARQMKDTREMEQDLRWVRSQIFAEPDYEKISDGDEIETLTLGEVRWETQVELSPVVDVYKVILTLEYDGSEEMGIESGERESVMYLLRPTWSKHGDFATDRARLLQDKRDKIREIREEMRR